MGGGRTAMDVQPYRSPVEISKYPSLAIFFLLSGFIAMAAFFVHQMQRKKAGTSGIVVEILFGLVASVLLGVGSFFGMMVFDLYI